MPGLLARPFAKPDWRGAQPPKWNKACHYPGTMGLATSVDLKAFSNKLLHKRIEAMAKLTDKSVKFSILGKDVDCPPNDKAYIVGGKSNTTRLYTGSTSNFIGKTYRLNFRNGESRGDSSEESIKFTGQQNFNWCESWHCTDSGGCVDLTVTSPVLADFFLRTTYQQHVGGTKKATSAGLTSTGPDGTKRTTSWRMNTNQPNWGANDSPPFRIGSGKSLLEFVVWIAEDNGFYLASLELIPINHGTRNLYIDFYWLCIESIGLTTASGTKYTKEIRYKYGVDTTKSQTTEFATDLSLGMDTEIAGVALSLKANFSDKVIDTDSITLKEEKEAKDTVEHDSDEDGQLMVWIPVVVYKIGDGSEQHAITMRLSGSTNTFVPNP